MVKRHQGAMCADLGDHPITTFTAYIEHDEETGLYVGIVPGISGAHTQAATLDELRANLAEALALCLEENHERCRPAEG